jgi:hypothetical protein
VSLHLSLDSGWYCGDGAGLASGATVVDRRGKSLQAANFMPDYLAHQINGLTAFRRTECSQGYTKVYITWAHPFAGYQRWKRAYFVPESLG